MDKESILSILRSKGEANKWLSFQYVKNGLIPFIDWLFVFLEPVLSDYENLQPNKFLEIDIPAGYFILTNSRMFIYLGEKEIISKLERKKIEIEIVFSKNKTYREATTETREARHLFCILDNTLQFRNFIIKHTDTIQQHFDKWMTSRLEFENERLRNVSQ